jgi:cation/acetate symporter
VNDPQSQDETGARAAIEGRVVFVVAALVLAGALVAVIDRVGAPARLVTGLSPAIAMGGLVVLGFLAQAMQVNRFYAAGRMMPQKYVGLAVAGLAAALIPPMLPPGPPGGLHAAMLAGLVVGVAIAGFISGPILRKSGAFSAPDLFGMRFESPALRAASAAIVAIACALVALAGFDGAIRSLQDALGLAAAPAAVLAGFIVFSVVAPGGLAGSAWSAAVCAFVLSLALLLPLAVLAAAGSPLPTPHVGHADLWAEALTRMAIWNPPEKASAMQFAATAAAVALGVAAMAPLLSPMIASRSARSTGRAGFVAVASLLLLVAALAGGMAISALALDALVVGQRADALPAFAYVASDKGLVTICGHAAPSPRAAALLCSGAENYSGRLGLDNIWASGRFLLTGLPELGRFSLAISGLVNAGYLAIALALAAAGVQTCATALAHDLLFAAQEGQGLASRRLAAARIIMVAMTLGMIYLASTATHAPQQLLALAILFSASTIAPLLLLSTWSRATASDAAMAFGVGACALVITIALAWRDGGFQMQIIATGALAGFFTATLLGFASSLRRKESETRPGRIFVEGLLYGDGEAMGADRSV